MPNRALAIGLVTLAGLGVWLIYGVSEIQSPPVPVVSGIEVIAHPGHVGGVARAAFFPGGERLITTGWHGELRVWDTSNGSLVGLYRGHDHRVLAIAVSPSGERFVSGDSAGNVWLWSVGDPDPHELWRHSQPVSGVAFVGESELLSLAGAEELVSHDLFRNESSRIPIPGQTPPPTGGALVGSEYLLLYNDEGHWPSWWRTARKGRLLDLETLNPIADLPAVIAQAVSSGKMPLPWGGSVLFSPSEYSTFDVSMFGFDPATGNLLVMPFCTANYCSRQTLDLLAFDGQSQRVAYVTNSEGLIEHAAGVGLHRLQRRDYDEQANVLGIAAINRLDQLVAAGESWEALEREGVIRLSPMYDRDGGVTILSHVGKVPDARREVPPGASLAAYGDDLIPPRDTAAVRGGVASLPKGLVQGVSLGQPNQPVSHPFVLEGDYQFGELTVVEGDRHVQDLGSSYSSDICSGTANHCSWGATGVSAMSSDGRWIAGSTDNGWFETSLWLYHDVGTIEAAQRQLHQLGHLAEEVRGIGGDGHYVLKVAPGDPTPDGTVELDRWLVDGEWIELRDRLRLENPYDIGGTSFREFRNEDGKWEDWSGPVSIRKTRLARTVEAILGFQASRGFPRTGVLDLRTREALRIPGEMAAPDAARGRWLRYLLPRELRVWHFHQGVAFAPDGARMAVADGSDVYALDLTSGAFEKVGSTDGEVVSLAFLSIDELLVAHPFGLDALDLATGRSRASAVGELAATNDVSAYDGGNLVQIEGGEFIVLMRRDGRNEPFEEVVRVRRKSEDAWVAATPAGFFAGTERFARSMYVRIGAQVLALDQFYGSLYRPDLVRERLIGDPEGRYAEAASRMNALRLATEGPPPSVEILWPKTGHMTNDRNLRVAVRLTDEGGGIGKVEWRVNGMTVGVDGGKRGLAAVRPDAERMLALLPGRNRIEVSAYNAAGGIASIPAAVDVNFEGLVGDPRLFVLAVGVEDYRDRSLRLRFAVDDVDALTGELGERSADLFETVFVESLLDADVTMERLTAAFASLQDRVRPEDVFVLFLAGHGVTVDGRYYFLPVDFRYHNEGSFRESAIGQDDLQGWLSSILASKSMVLLDTCNSGSYVEAQQLSRGMAEKTALDKLIRATGRATISASSASEVALEGVDGHGVLTYALLKGLEDGDRKAGNRDGWVSTLELTAFVADAVPDLTMAHFGYEQVPQFNLHGMDFPIARAQ